MFELFVCPGQPRVDSLKVTEVQSRGARVSWEWNHLLRVRVFALRVYQGQSDSEDQVIWVLPQRRSSEISHLLPNTSYTISVRAGTETGVTEGTMAPLTTAPGAAPPPPPDSSS